MRPREMAVTCLRRGVTGRKRRTPTVVKTSWSLFTRVMSPGSLTFMLHMALAVRAARGYLGWACAYAFGLVAMTGECDGGVARGCSVL
jgi:hypothetical protein